MFNEYDIPDEHRPEQKQIDPMRELQDKIDYNNEQIRRYHKLRNYARKILKEQNDKWDAYGDHYNMQAIPNFVNKFKDDIFGVLKDAEYIDYGDGWKYNMGYYTAVIDKFIERTQYVIGNYERTNKKLERTRS